MNQTSFMILFVNNLFWMSDVNELIKVIGSDIMTEPKIRNYSFVLILVIGVWEGFVLSWG